MDEPKNSSPEQKQTRTDVVPIASRAIGELAADLRGLIEAARERVAQTVNAELVMLNWRIGNRIRRDILAETRAGYGEQIVSTLSRQLTVEYGAGFSRPNLFHMIRFVEAWPDEAQVTGFAQHLGWSHFKEILYLEDQLAGCGAPSWSRSMSNTFSCAMRAGS